MVSSGISDKIKINKETTYADGGAGAEKVFGVTKKFEWKAETGVAQSYGLETAGPQATVNHDGVLSVSGTHEWELTDGREFEAILGTLSDGTGTFSLDVANALPSYTAKVVDETALTGTYVAISGIKYSKFSLKLARGEDPITITADWIGKTIANTGSFTPTVSSVEPLMYLDGFFQIDSAKQTEVEDFTLEIDRKCVGRRFMEDTTAGSRRLISAIVEGPLTLTYNGNMAAKRKVIEEIWGSTTLQDTRSDKTILLHVGRGSMNLNLSITGGRHASAGRILEKTQEVSLMDFNGIGIDISGTGSYAT